MRSRNHYVVGRWRFDTQKDLVARARAILHGARPGVPLEGEDFEFMRALLARHPHAAAKIGPGVASIRVGPNPVWENGPSFFVRRMDGSETDFSYRECIRPSSPERDFQAACRRAVLEDVLRFKKAHFESHADGVNQVRCAVSGDWVGWFNCHVDHEPPWTFQRIVEGFLDQERIEPARVEFAGHGDNDMEVRFADPALADQFQRFHAERARLRMVGSAAHLRLARGRATG